VCCEHASSGTANVCMCAHTIVDDQGIIPMLKLP
jgi:hypothetical protein